MIEKLIAATSNRSFWVRDDERDGSEGEESPWEKWKASRIPPAIDALLSAHDNMEDDVPRTTTQTEGLNPLWSPSEFSSGLERLLHSDTRDLTRRRSSGGAHEQATELPGGTASQIQIGAEAPVYPSQTAQGAWPKLPPNPLQLLNRYFALTHSWLPIVERHAVYRIFFAYHKNPVASSISRQDSGDIAVLWAMFAYTSMIGGSHNNEGNSAVKYSTHLDELYMVARNAIPLEKEDNYSTGHVQALLILGLLHYSSGEWNIARVVIGQATLLATRIGLDQVDQCYTDHHRRTWLGCFVLDTFISVHTGKVPWIRSNQVKVHLPIDETGNEEWEPWHLQEALLPDVGAEMAEFSAPTHTLTVFTKLLELLCVTNDWICSTTDKQKDQCREALVFWNQELPDHIRCFGGETSRTTPVPAPPNMLNLRIIHAYLRTEFSHPTPSRSRRKRWEVLIQAVEVFFKLFGPEAVPPSFDLLGKVLSLPVAETRPILDLIAELKSFSDNQLTDVSFSDDGDRNIITNEDLVSATMSYLVLQPRRRFVPMDSYTYTCCLPQPPRKHNPLNIETSAVTSNSNSQAEPDLDPIMNMSGSWLTGAADLLEPQGEPEDPCSQEGQLTALTTSRGDFPDETTLGYINYWEDVEMHVQPPLFKRIWLLTISP